MPKPMPGFHRPMRPESETTDGDLPENDHLDLDGENGAFSGHAPEGGGEPEEVSAELRVARDVARRAGWVPLSEWKRDPSKWEDADRFLEHLPDRINSMRATREATAATMEATWAELQRRTREDAERQLNNARETGNVDEAVQAATRLTQANAPPPLVSQWVASRPWFEPGPNFHPRARALAVATTEEMHQRGATISDQLREADREVSRVYPELYGNEGGGEIDGSAAPQPQQRGETRLSDIRRTTHQAPHSGPSSGSTTTRPKAKDYKSLPPDAKAAYESYFKSRGVDQERYAATFYRERDAKASRARSRGFIA